MIFGIDVRHKICNNNETWMNYVDLNATACLLRSDEEDPEIREKLNDIVRLTSEIVELKKKTLHEIIKNFEKEFVIDVINNVDSYKFMLNID